MPNSKLTQDHLIATARQAEITAMQAKRAIGLLDLTSLNDDDTTASITALCQRAQTPVGPVAAVCVYPAFVTTARTVLANSAAHSSIRVATVVNFPSGAQDHAIVQQDTQQALDAGADEIDIVLPYQAYLNGDRPRALRLLTSICQLCAGRARVKAILETGALQQPALILAASRDAIAAGVDFIKTSTGKIDKSASLEACLMMLQAIHTQLQHNGRRIGLKPSGGIRTSTEAAQYLALADSMMGADWATAETFRFGASSLLDALLHTVGHNTDNLPSDTY